MNHSIKVGVVILCRFESTRLRGKILKNLVGYPALWHTYSKLREIFTEDQIVVATSNHSSDDTISAYCNEHNIHCYRGSLQNVAERFLHAAEFMHFDYAARTNGDNVFIDLDTYAKIVQLAKNNAYNFISNVKDRTFPKGMSIEMVRVEFYRSLQPTIQTSSEFIEHVTLALYKNPDPSFRFVYNEEVKNIQGIDLALDTEDDFRRIENMIQFLKERYKNYNLTDIKEAYEHVEG
ncbi:MAG: spore coat polysaccharide biosynthesis protein SpsF [Bacteroidia bacterium]|jgi:spore coat polysaccharide biosynthesis protein SpsF